MRTQMLNKKIKSGFTLIELMVFFIFISLIMAAATPIITKRVKNIPLKMNHGKFICYGGRYELYNSTRMIGSGAGCQFKPPRRAALYKIELVGAGAGGYSYTEAVTEAMVEGNGGYRMTSGHYGDGYTELSNAQLWNAFRNATFTLTKYAEGAGYGGEPSRTYTGVEAPSITRSKECFKSYDYIDKCTRKVDDLTKPIKDKDGKPTGKYEQKDEEYDCQKTQRDDPTGKLETCSDYDARLTAAENKIASWFGCSSGDRCRILYTSVLESAKEVASKVPGTLHNFGTGRTMYSWSASSGSGIYLKLDGAIDFRDYNNGGQYIKASDVKSYLRNLLTSYYVTGTSQYEGSCDGWGYTGYDYHDGTYPNRYHGSANLNLQNDDIVWTGEWGKDVLHYAAIKAWGRCATNRVRATGGEGGQIHYYEGDRIFAYDGKERGTNASGTSGVTRYGRIPYVITAVSSASRKEPYVITKTRLNERYHAVGNGGGGASYKVAYVPSLSNDCVFSVASGGQAIDKNIANSQLTYLHNGLATTLSCNKGTLNLKADGGYYNKDITRKSYNGFDNIKSDGTPRSTAPYVTEGRAPGGSPFTSSDVFTKYNLTGGGFGAGGTGSSIVDECSKPWGEYWIWLAYNESEKYQRDHQNIEKTACNEATQVQYKEAQAGTGGIIIISW